MLRLDYLLIGSADPEKLAKFYEEVFQKKPDMDEGGYKGWKIGEGFLTVGEHSEIKGKSKEPQRLIFNFESNEVEEEFERISKIEGAEIIKKPYDMYGSKIATLADPDGNYFQLMSPWDGASN